MRSGSRSLLAFFFLALPWAPVRGEEPHVHAELIAETESIRPGVPFWTAVRLRMDKGWHTYWKNSGESGLATKVQWDLPPGFSAGPLEWPAPRRIVVGGVVGYGYEDEVHLLTRIEPPAVFRDRSARLRARVDWLECEEICIPGRAELTLELPVADAPPKPAADRAEAFAAARSRLPLEDAGWTAVARRSGDRIRLTVRPPEGLEGGLSGLIFFPEAPGMIDDAAPQAFRRAGKDYSLDMTASSLGRTSVLRGVLVTPEGWRGPGSEKALRVDVPLEPGPAGAAADGGFGAALGLAFLGGLLLNLMPCVLPVLSLKILGFVQQAGGDRARTRAHGLLFTAGVLASFWALAGALLALRAGGQQIGWGFQLQSPAFVAALACLFFLLALNLFGVFEAGASLTALGGASRPGGLAGSFWSGVLATVVATPCTAPFMGTALGVALTQPAWGAMTLFTALGAGMALPYLLLSFRPTLLPFVPRPGRWMETFKQAMGFVLAATVVWLAWVLGRQAGVGPLVALLEALVALGLGGWIRGRWGAPVHPPRARRIAAAVAALLILGGAGWAVRQASGGSAAGSVSPPSGGIPWEPFSPGRVEALRRDGRIVFVDFTAAWCLTCQVNERVALGAEQVVRRFRELDVAALKADWTSRDETITRALQSFGRSGVPVYALYGKDAREAALLPSVLTPSIVLQALEEASVSNTRKGDEP